MLLYINLSIQKLIVLVVIINQRPLNHSMVLILALSNARVKYSKENNLKLLNGALLLVIL